MKPVILKVKIECEVDAFGNLGSLRVDAGSNGKNRPVIRRSFMDVTPPICRDLLAKCFNLERMKSEAAKA